MKKTSMACSNLKAQLLETSLTLEHKYNLPVEKRMTEYKIRNFYRIISITNPQKRLNELMLFTEDYSVFHPQAATHVKLNIERKYETNLSTAVLLQISMGELEPSRLRGIIASYKYLSANICNNDPENLYNLGCIYFVKHDYERSANFYRESALKGYHPAQFRLGTAYHLSIIQAQEFPQIIKKLSNWYTNAAEHGLTKA